MATPLDPTYQPPQGATLTEAGVWVMPDGNFAPGQEQTLQALHRTSASEAQNTRMDEQKTYFDPQKKLSYQLHGGKKWYVSPGGPTPEGGGGLVHGRMEWDPEKGEFVSHYDMGKIMSLVAAGVLTAGAANAITGGAASGAATGSGGAASPLASSATAPLASTLPGAASTSTVVGGTAATAPVSTLGTIGGVLKKAEPLLHGMGKAVGDAATAAGQNRLDQEHLALTANGQNILGQSSFEQELMNRAHTEADQRKDALKDVYRASYAKNATAGPYNPRGIRPQSPEYLAALGNLESQGSARLATGAQYSTNAMAPLAPYTPVPVNNVQGATGTKKGTLETIGDWLSPALSTTEKLSRLWR